MTNFKEYFYLTEQTIRDPNHIIKGDYIQNIYIANNRLEKLPDYSRITVTGDFDCNNNDIINLIGSPKDVQGTFWCEGNIKLENLIGCSKHISGNFECAGNQNLITLKGAPRSINRCFNCGYNNSLTSLLYAPETIGENFYCNNFENLTILEGGPKIVRGTFNCIGCPSIREDQWQYLPIIGGALITDKDLSRNELLTLQRLQALGRIGELVLRGNIEQSEEDDDPFNL
jgi:hypothetical protein